MFNQQNNEILNYYHPSIIFTVHQTRAYQEYSKIFFKKHSADADKIRLRTRPNQAANIDQDI